MWLECSHFTLHFELNHIRAANPPAKICPEIPLLLAVAVS